MSIRALVVVALFSILPFAWVAPAAAQGTFEGTLGAGVVTGSARGTRGGAAAGARGAAATGETIRIQIDSLSTPEEQAAIRGATTVNALLDAIRTFRRGTVTIAGRAFPIHAAFRGPNGRYTLLTASDAYGAAGARAGAAAASIAVLTIAPNATSGALFTTTQVVAWSDETGEAGRAGRSALREINGLRAL